MINSDFDFSLSLIKGAYYLSVQKKYSRTSVKKPDYSAFFLLPARNQTAENTIKTEMIRYMAA